MATIITVTSIVNHGSVVQLLGHTTHCHNARHDTPCPFPCSTCTDECGEGESRTVSVVGDWRPMSDALYALNVEVGSEVGVGTNIEGQQCLFDPSELDAWQQDAE